MNCFWTFRCSVREGWVGLGWRTCVVSHSVWKLEGQRTGRKKKEREEEKREEEEEEEAYKLGRLDFDWWNLSRVVWVNACNCLVYALASIYQIAGTTSSSDALTPGASLPSHPSPCLPAGASSSFIRCWFRLDWMSYAWSILFNTKNKIAGSSFSLRPWPRERACYTTARAQLNSKGMRVAVVADSPVLALNSLGRRRRCSKYHARLGLGPWRRKRDRPESQINDVNRGECFTVDVRS